MVAASVLHTQGLLLKVARKISTNTYSPAVARVIAAIFPPTYTDACVHYAPTIIRRIYSVLRKVRTWQKVKTA